MFDGDEDPIFPLFKPGAIDKLAFSMAQVITPIILALMAPLAQKLQEKGRAKSGGRIKRY